MTDWFSERFREAISATDLKGLLSGPWKLKVAALALAFLLWILVRLSVQLEVPLSSRKGNSYHASTMEYLEDRVVYQMVQ